MEFVFHGDHNGCSLLMGGVQVGKGGRGVGKNGAG